MRKKIAAGNWKMNTTPQEGLLLATEVAGMVKDEVDPQVQVVLAPPFTHLYAVKKAIEGIDNLVLAAQNCSHKPSGAFTGEVSVGMLKELGVGYVILGHSERRQYFQESGTFLAQKVTLCLQEGLRPIFCCGESLNQRENEDYVALVSLQLSEALFHLSAVEIRQVVIAYEPVWAIGTGKTASAAQAQEMHAALRGHLSGKYGTEVASQVSILYGGSVNAGNAAELFSQEDVDGGLVGGASLKPREFVNIAKAFVY
jgi:triosephosphate isomerase